jgi:uncharacterized membrane protein
MDSLAARGLIDESAPVKAAAQVIIKAPATKIWGLLTNIKDWSTWQPDISDVAMEPLLRFPSHSHGRREA